MKYSSFWQRLAAVFVDIGLFLPIFALVQWLENSSRFGAIALLVPASLLVNAYPVYFHGRFGQTIGKRFVRIKLIQATGEPAGWREAWLRSSVDIAFAILALIAQYIALQTISDLQYISSGWLERTRLLQSYEPASLSWVYVTSSAWAWSELATMLLNKRRRALHDFIAGTVVVQMADTT